MISENGVRAATISCAVGSLRQAHLRMADAASGSSFDGPFEIVSCTGTLGVGGLHVHVSLSDKNGKTIGGHLLPGCIARDAPVQNLDIIFGTNFLREIPKDGFSGDAVYFKKHAPHADDAADTSGWFLAFSFDSKGKITKYYISNVNK